MSTGPWSIHWTSKWRMLRKMVLIALVEPRCLLHTTAYTASSLSRKGTVDNACWKNAGAGRTSECSADLCVKQSVCRTWDRVRVDTKKICPWHCGVWPKFALYNNFQICVWQNPTKRRWVWDNHDLVYQYIAFSVYGSLWHDKPCRYALYFHEIRGFHKNRSSNIFIRSSQLFSCR